VPISQHKSPKQTSGGRLRDDLPEWCCRRGLDETVRLDWDSVPKSCLSTRGGLLPGSDFTDDNFTHHRNTSLNSFNVAFLS